MDIICVRSADLEQRWFYGNAVSRAPEEKKAGAMEPDGSVPNRRKEEGWWEAMEPYHGARPRTTERYSWSEPTKQRMVTGGGIGRYSVSYAAISRGVTDGKPIFEDAEGTSARAPGMPGGTYDNKGTLV